MNEASVGEMANEALRRLALLSMLACAIAGCTQEEPSSPGRPQHPPDSPVAEVTAASVERDSRSFGRFTLEHAQLDNGLELWIVEEHAAPVVALQTWIRAGSRDDPAARCGAAHLLEHLMFRASEALDDGVFDERMERHGIDASAATWADYTVYDAKLPTAALAEVLSLEAERFAHVRIDQTLLDAERDVILRERAFRVDNSPDGILSEALYEAAFPTHAYRNPTVGRSADLRALTVAELQAFHARHYRASNTAIFLVGDVDSEQALALLQQSHGQLESAMAKPSPGAIADPSHAFAARRSNCEPLPEAPRAQTFAMPVGEEMLLLGYPSPPAASAESAALLVLNEALFAEPFGSLYRELKLEREWVSEIEGWVGEFACRSLWEISATMRSGVLARDVRREVLATLSRTAREGLDDASLRRAKKRLELDSLQDASDSARLADRLGQFWASSGDPAAFFARLELIRAVDSAAVRRLAQDWLGASRLTEVLATPSEEP